MSKYTYILCITCNIFPSSSTGVPRRERVTTFLTKYLKIHKFLLKILIIPRLNGRKSASMGHVFYVEDILQLKSFFLVHGFRYRFPRRMWSSPQLPIKRGQRCRIPNRNLSSLSDLTNEKFYSNTISCMKYIKNYIQQLLPHVNTTPPKNR